MVGTFHPFRGGLAAFNERLANEFLKEGHEVIIYTFKLQYPNFLFPGKTQYADWDAPKELDIRIKINSINPLNWIKVGREIRQLKADMVVYCYWMSFMAPCFGTIARLVKAPKTRNYAMVHNMIPHETTILDKVFPKYFVNIMDGFVAMAESVKKDIINLDTANKTVLVSPHPVYDHYGEKTSKQEAAAVLNLNPDDHYILFFGFVRAYKGLDLLLKAFGDHRLRNKNVKLIVAGEFYENENEYLNLIRTQKLEEYIVLHNTFIAEDQVRYFFSVCDIVVQPYKSATQSGVTQIAYHFEKPMLVTDVGGLKEIVPHGKVGYVTLPDEKDIADSLLDFYENNREEAFVEGTKSEKKKFLWSKMTSTFYELEKQVNGRVVQDKLS